MSDLFPVVSLNKKLFDGTFMGRFKIILVFETCEYFEIICFISDGKYIFK